MDKNKHTYEFPKVDVTATVIVASKFGHILLGKRTDETTAFPGDWCLPGGFIIPNKETLEECASRELYEETGIRSDPKDMIPVNIHSQVGTDPRGHVVNVTFLYQIDKFPPLMAGDDIVDLQYVLIEDLDKYTMAFNHKELINKMLQQFEQYDAENS